MFIGVYLAIWALITFLILISKSTLRQRRYLALSGLLAGLVLATFLTLSAWAGIFMIGETSSFSIPGDYLARGPAGWFALFFGLLGLLSPVLATWISTRIKPRIAE